MRLASRHIVWLAAAVLTPCVALTLLTLRLLDRERQLAARRAREVQERRVEDARRTLLAAIEPYRLGQTPEQQVAFRGVIRDGRVVLAWEGRAAAAELARLEQAVRTRSATEFRRIAALGSAVVDEHGVPLAVYAIPHLPAGAPSGAGFSPRGALAPHVRPRVAALQALAAQLLAEPHGVSATGLHLLQALAADNGLAELAGALRQAAENADAGERFQGAYPQLGGASAGRWLAWGTPLFLVGFAPSAKPGDLGFRAVPAAAGLSLEKGQPLGEPFGALRIQLPARAAEPEGSNRPLLLSMFALTVGLALGGGLLLWRDARREMALAQLRTQFIASVSHELRTPLTAVRMFIESLKMNPDLDAATRADYLDTMLRETERLSRLVNNVLEFSRIERHQKTYDLRPAALADIVHSVVTSFGPLVEQAGYQLETVIDEDVGEAKADPDALEQAILNLLTNAMKYSGASRRIQLKLARLGERAAIEVRDFGIGIATGEHRKIFDSFYRVPSRENRNVPGAGLGLTLVRHVIEGHGGEVLVESAPGKGSAFTLVLPL